MLELDSRRPAACGRGTRVRHDVGYGRVVDKHLARGRPPRPPRRPERLRGRAVVQRQHAVHLRLLPPQLDHRLQTLRMLLGEVVGFGKILVEVIELPLVVIVPGRTRHMPHHGLPAVLPDAAMPEHLEVLDASRRCCVGGGQRRGERGAVQRHLRHAVVLRGRLGAGELEDRRHDVDRVTEGTADGPYPLQRTRPVDDQRVAHTAAVGVLLVPLERRVADLRPAPGNVGVALWTADVIEPLHRLVDIFDHAVEPPHLVENAGRTAFLAGAVVRHDDEERIVEAVDFLQESHQSTDLRVRVVELGGERFLQTRGELAFVRGEFGPRPDPWVQGSKTGALRDDAKCLLPLEPVRPGRIPARIETAPVLVAVGLRRLVGRVRGTERHVQEEGALRSERYLIAQHGDGTIDHILRDVVAGFGQRRCLDVVVVAREFGIELVCLALHEAVEAVESPLQRPVVEWPGGGALGHRRQVPFAGGVRSIAGAAQHVRHRRGRSGQ